MLPASGVHFNEARGFNEPLQRLRRFCEDNGLACKYTSGYASVEVELLHDGRRAGKHWRLKFDRQKAGGRREAQTLLCSWMLEYAKWLILSGVVPAPIVRRTECWLSVLPPSVKIVNMTEMSAPAKEEHASSAFPPTELQSVGVVAFDFEGCDAEGDYTVVQVACARAQTPRTPALSNAIPLTPARRPVSKTLSASTGSSHALRRGGISSFAPPTWYTPSSQRRMRR